MAASSIDIHQPGKYPIVLSDALLGKTTKEVYTGVRYNYKPNVSSNSPSSSLRPSDSDSSSYDLSLKDNSNKYSYTGARTTGDGQYVLIFDPAKEHFVLHRIDSTFDMNLVSDPWTDDASALRSEHPQLESDTIQAAPPQRRASKGKKVAAAAAAKTEAPRKKINAPKKTKPPVREPTPEEDDESDDGFTVEDPDSVPTNLYQSQPVYQRQVSEEVSDEDEDAEHELYEEDEHNQDVDHLKLPSPAANAGGMSDEDFEADLEKELEAEFEEALKENHEADESSESEEE